LARRGWSSGGAIAIGSQNKLRMGLFNGRASWDRYQPQEKLQGHGAMLEYSLGYPGSNLHSLSVQTGFVREQNSFLGTSIGPALGSLGQAETLFVGLNGHVQIDKRWQALLALYSGSTYTGAVNSQIFAVDSQIRSGSWALGFKGRSLWRVNDQLSLYLTQPLRVKSGRAALKLATGRTWDRQVIYQDISLELQPPGREHRLELGYHLPTRIAQRQAWFSATSQYIQQPSHSPINPQHLVVKLMFSISID